MNAASLHARADFKVIARWIPEHARVLDLGCGDGSLLQFLAETRGVQGYGVEISPDNIVACVRNGVNVIQDDLETGLHEIEDAAFDFVILSQTLQAMRHTEDIVDEMLRVGQQAIVTFPNFGYWRNRLAVARGNMPVSRNLPYEWYDTPNVHLCTIDDFERFCTKRRVRICERVVLSDGSEVAALPNLLGQLAVYRFERQLGASPS
ncbi:MAG: methionine biosynthesis protein MetW [Burkholderiales bacterium]|nr:methionine biosynthesis protein MetW [Burkholderiales bacterium]